ncbi:MAG TPA: hypothetical protein VFJ43_00730, partial [Bacteroidia bacterium]|nr:hypothetical protein [Bacteroidia bacterium]
MKKYSFLISSLFFILNSCNPKTENTAKISTEKDWRSHGPKMKLDGIYTGKNLYVQNPFSDLGGFCVTEKPIVNGDVSTALIHSSAFEIDLNAYKL